MRVPKPVKGKDAIKGTSVGDRPPRLSALHATHQALGAQFVARAGWQVPHLYTSPEDEAAAIRERVGVADLSSLGKLQVRGHAAQELLTEVLGARSVAPGYASPIVNEDQAGPSSGGGYCARLTRDEFLVITPPGDEEEVARNIEEGHLARGLFVTVINRTSGLAGLVVVGPVSQDVLSKLCALPLSPVDFPNYCMAQSSLAKVHTILVRNDMGSLPAFELYFERVYGEYVWTSVVDAGHEFGIVPLGWGAKDLL